jgi:hypothetical protein
MEKSTVHANIGTFLVQGVSVEKGMQVSVLNIGIGKPFVVHVIREMFEEDVLHELLEAFMQRKPVYMHLYELKKIRSTVYVLSDFNFEKPYA